MKLQRLLKSLTHGYLIASLALISLSAGFVGWRTQAKYKAEQKTGAALTSASRLRAYGELTSCNAVVDDGVNLCVPVGMTYNLVGDLCYSGKILVAGTLQVTPYNGQTGGSLVLRAPNIEVTGTGLISADAAGRTGGSPGQNLNTGGGAGQLEPGAGCGGGNGSSVGQGGSGGGYGGGGGTPDNQWANSNACNVCSNATIPHCEGNPGVTVGTDNGPDYDLGNGGGAGGNSAGCSNSGGRGGKGGGAIVLLGNNIIVDGTVSAAGEKPPSDTSTCGYRPGGGGGSGGSVVVRANTLSGGGSLRAPGGAGGDGIGDTNTGTWGWSGGGGGGGRVKVFTTTNNFAGTSSAAAGAGGAQCPGDKCFAGSPGTAGTTYSGTIPPTLNDIGCPFQANLSVSKNDNVTLAVPGGMVTYTITVSNAGPTAASGVTVADPLPTGISSANWTCVGSGGGTCTASGSGGLNETVNLPVGAAVTYTVIANIASNAAGTITNTVTASTAGNVVDPQPNDNSATDTDQVCSFNPVVTNGDDSGAGSLRDAIAVACPGSTITFASGVSTITLTSGELSINKNLTIQGPGANLLSVQRASNAGKFRLFSITANTTVNLSKLTISGGRTADAPLSVENAGNGGDGGGLYNAGRLTLDAVAVSGNTTGRGGSAAVGYGGSGGSGGGIYNAGTLTLLNSTVSGNATGSAVLSAGSGGGPGGNGGGIYSGGTLTLINSTISGNTTGSGGGHDLSPGAGGSGGGIYSSGLLTAFNSTISRNATGSGGNSNSGPNGAGGNGGGIYSGFGSIAMNVRNTIIAGNSASSSPDVFGAFTSQGHNLIGRSDGSSGFTNASNGDQVGTTNSPLDPRFASLANNGGPTQTHALLPDSPALDAGNNCVLTAQGCGANDPPTALTTDQRGTGFSRQVGSAVDIGAFEANYSLTATGGTPQSATVNTAFPHPLSATLTESGTPLSGVAITFTANPAGNGASATLGTPNPATTDSQGRASVTATANGVFGAYQVTAGGAGLTPVVFNLANTCGALALSPSSLPGGTVGASYAQALSVSGAFGGSAAFSLSGGSLPPGLTLAANGALGGVPTTVGSFNFTVKATDTLGCFGTQSYAVNIACAPLVVSPASLANAQAGVAFAQSLSATGSGARSFSLAANPAPPAWLSLTPNGLLSGTPNALGSFSFVVNVSDAHGCTGAQPYTLSVGCPTFALANLAAATAGTAYNAPLVASPSGGNFQFSSANKPAWLTLTSSGALSGTPPTAGTFSFNVVVTGFGSCTQTLPVTLVVNCPAVSFTPASLPNANVGAAYQATVTASPAGTTYSYLLLGSPLPPGLSLDSATGLISGTPTAAGNYAFVITALGWGDCRAQQTYNLLVTATCPTVTLTPSSLAGGTVGTSYSQSLTASGATGPFTWAVTSGSLPAGLTLTSGGSLTGTPTTAGSFNFTVTATNGSGCAGSQSFTLVVTCPTLTLEPASLTNATAGVAYNQSFTLTPSGAATFSLATGSLPPGLNLTSAGVLSGTATATGSYSFSVKAERGSCNVTKAYTLVVSCPTVTVNPTSLVNGAGGSAYNQTLSATPSGSYSFVVSAGTLPGGLTLSTAGVLSGTPTASGTFSFTARATAFGSCAGTRNFTLTIAAACATITLPSLANGAVSANYYGDLSATTPSGSYTFSLTSGSLPPGLVIDNLFGALTGTPTTAGTFAFTLQATNANGCSGTRAYSFVVSSGAVARAELADYDGDGASDPALWSASDGVWRVQPSSGAAFAETAWGGAGDVTLLGDYDGDGRTDLAVFRPSNATWYVKRSSDGQALVRSFGQSSDVPTPGDYDGDGRTDFAVWRGKTGEWLIQRSSDGQPQSLLWGSSAAAYQDVPVAGDFDGDGQTDLAVFRRTTGTWLVKRSSDEQFLVKAWGYGTDTPVAADYDGDGRTDIAVWRGTTGEWFVLRSTDGGFAVTKWGGAAYQDVPVAGDYDGDGQTDLTVWRAPARQWFIQATRAAAAQVVPQGQASDAPVAARR